MSLKEYLQKLITINKTLCLFSFLFLNGWMKTNSQVNDEEINTFSMIYRLAFHANKRLWLPAEHFLLLLMGRWTERMDCLTHVQLHRSLHPYLCLFELLLELVHSVESNKIISKLWKVKILNKLNNFVLKWIYSNKYTVILYVQMQFQLLDMLQLSMGSKLVFLVFVFQPTVEVHPMHKLHKMLCQTNAPMQQLWIQLTIHLFSENIFFIQSKFIFVPSKFNAISEHSRSHWGSF